MTATDTADLIRRLQGPYPDSEAMRAAASALREAHASGRKAALEEAAKVVEGYWAEHEANDMDHIGRIIATAIRALGTQDTAGSEE
jgi:predicted metal-dependent hydrolase